MRHFIGIIIMFLFLNISAAPIVSADEKGYSTGLYKKVEYKRPEGQSVLDARKARFEKKKKLKKEDNKDLYDKEKYKDQLINDQKKTDVKEVEEKADKKEEQQLKPKAINKIKERMKAREFNRLKFKEHGKPGKYDKSRDRD